MGSSCTPRRLWTLALCVFSVLLAPAAAHADGRWVVQDTAPDWASPSTRAAAAPNSDKMVFSVWLGWRNTAGLTSTLQDMYDPSSPSYQQWLTPAQFHQSYSPAPSEVAEVRSWLVKQGFIVVDVPANNLFVTAAGSTAQVEHAFNVNINLYHLDGRLVRAPNQDPTVPLPLAQQVRAITGLDGALTLTSPSHSAHLAHPRPAAQTQPPPPPAGTSVGPCSRYWGEKTSTAFPNPYSPGTPLPWNPCGYQPRQIMSAYGIDHLHAIGLRGRGQTIAITGAFFSPTLLSDANRFSREFHLPTLRGDEHHRRHHGGNAPGEYACAIARIEVAEIRHPGFASTSGYNPALHPVAVNKVITTGL